MILGYRKLKEEKEQTQFALSEKIWERRFSRATFLWEDAYCLFVCLHFLSQKWLLDSQRHL